MIIIHTATRKDIKHLSDSTTTTSFTTFFVVVVVIDGFFLCFWRAPTTERAAQHGNHFDSKFPSE